MMFSTSKWNADFNNLYFCKNNKSTEQNSLGVSVEDFVSSGLNSLSIMNENLACMTV